MRCVRLDPGLEGRRLAYLRAPAGADEMAAESGATVLLDRLLVNAGSEAVAPGEAARLPVSDRDRLLAALQQDLFGDALDAEAPCPDCGTPFSLRFSLNALIEGTAHPRPELAEGPDAQGHYRLHGVTFRLPSTLDLTAVAGRPAEARRDALLAACVVAGDAGSRAEEIEGAMAALGPTLDQDIEARCPHCERTSNLRFSIGGYLLRGLANERRFLLREVHRIARSYGWSYVEIMGLPRQVRQDFVRLIDGTGKPAGIAGGAA